MGLLLRVMGKPPEELLVVITEAVADSLGRPIDALPPLIETIDPERLVRLLSTANDSSDVSVSFQYADHRVHVLSEQTVYVRPLPAEHEEPVERV